MSEARKLAAILAADVVGYSRLMGADEEGTLARLRALRGDLLDPAIAVHRGRVVKRTGDGAIVEFKSAVDAVRCAIEIQNGMAGRNAGQPEDSRIVFRIGVHVGDVIEEADGDLMGDGVNIAARIEGACEPGGVCVSEDAWRQVKGRIRVTAADLGPTQLKNIAEPIRVYSLMVDAHPHANPPPDASAQHVLRRTRGGRISVAVLPFVNMSGDPEQEYFADGLSEDIITALSSSPFLFVIARNSAFAFKGKNVPIGEIAKSLGVRYVLEGSVRKSGTRVRITAQLIDAATGGHIWADRFDRDLTDIFAVQDDVRTQILVALELGLFGAQGVRPQRLDNPEAYDRLLRARDLALLPTKEANRDAQKLLREAIELCPGYAPGPAALSSLLAIAYVNGWSAAPEQTLKEAESLARQAVELSEHNPYALWALGFACLWTRRFDEAMSATGKTVAFNPNFVLGHITRGQVLHYVGRSEEALECFQQAMALDPYYPDIWLHLQAQATYQLGRYPETVALLKERISRNPETDASRVLLAAAYGQMGLIGEAREAWREALRVNPSYSLEQRRKALPYKNPEDFERIVDGLRKAGIAQ